MGPRTTAAPPNLYMGNHTDISRNGRVRVNRACLRCRSHKIKCTGTFPCGNCTKNNEDCRFGKDEPPAKARRTRSPEPSQGDAYTEYLESRVRYLESLLKRLMDENLYDDGERIPCYRRKRSYDERNNDNEESRWDRIDRLDREDRTQSRNPYIINYTDLYGRIAPHERDFRSNDKEYHAAERATNAMQQAMETADGTRQLENPEIAANGAGGESPQTRQESQRAWSSLAKWRMVDRPLLALVTELCSSVYAGLSESAKSQVNVPRRQFFGWNMSGCHYLRLEPFPPEPDMSLHSQAQLTAYVDHFFREINPLYAILHETVFREQLRASTADESASTNFTVLFRAMLCLVYALSIRFTEFVRPEGPSLEMLRWEETLFQYGHRVVLIILFEWELFELIQCWLLITLYLRTTHRQTSAFTALGRAVHMCRVMGLGRPPRLPLVPQYEVLKARRIFECVYCFDRVVGYFGGRRRSFPSVDISRRVPLLDYEVESERDDWITLPAFAMIHIARVANLIPLGQRTQIRTQMIDRELTRLDHWLRENGFGTAESIFAAENTTVDSILPTIRVQVRFHFYDLVLAVHGQVLFSILGRPLPTTGMRLDVVRSANSEVILLAQGLGRHGLLYVPWYTTLNLVFNAGICSLVLLQASVAVHDARRVLAGAMKVLEKLQDLPVYEDGKMLFFERFKMVRECMWALKTANHIVSLGFTEAAQGLRDLGIDHGNSDVNRQFFGQFGLMDAPVESLLDKLAHDQSRRGFQDRQKMAALISALSPESTFSQPNLMGYGGNEIIESLRWFDNWLDFGEAL